MVTMGIEAAGVAYREACLVVGRIQKVLGYGHNHGNYLRAIGGERLHNVVEVVNAYCAGQLSPRSIERIRSVNCAEFE